MLLKNLKFFKICFVGTEQRLNSNTHLTTFSHPCRVIFQGQLCHQLFYTDNLLTHSYKVDKLARLHKINLLITFLFVT